MRSNNSSALAGSILLRGLMGGLLDALTVGGPMPANAESSRFERSADQPIRVKGYTRKDGTRVHPYLRKR